MPDPDPPAAPTPPARRPPRRAGRGRLDPRVLAIGGLVLAVIPCCPMTGLTGALLGVLALRRIRLTEGPAPGTRLAVAAIVAGAASAFVWSIALDKLGRVQQEMLNEQVVDVMTAALQAAQDEDLDALRATWSAAPGGGSDQTGPPGEDVAAFGRETLERYGRVERFALISMTRSGTLFRPVIDVAGSGHFENGEPLVAARLELPMTGRIEPVARLMEITIEDEARGDLTLAAAPPAAPARPANPP